MILNYEVGKANCLELDEYMNYFQIFNFVKTN